MNLRRLLTGLALIALQCTCIEAQERYTEHSILSTGQWVKIRVAQTGPHLLTNDMLQQAGFTNPSHVRVFGYGGALQPEKLDETYLSATDDLPEALSTPVDGGIVFFAVGPVNWEQPSSVARVRNPYSDYGYYFITEIADENLSQQPTASGFLSQIYPHPNDYHALYEVDNFAWYHGGRNLFDAQLFGSGVTHDYTLQAPSSTGTLTVVMTYNDNFEAQVLVNGEAVGTMKVNKDKNSNKSEPNGHPFPDEYSKAASESWKMPVEGLTAETEVSIRQLSGGTIHLDYITLCCDKPKAAPDLTSDSLPVPEIVEPVANQDRHADDAAEMIIIIPTSQQLLGEAERLKQLHEEIDGFRVRIVPANELFNEFSSGTPDANAYRRYLKMLYDRAKNDDDKPRYLLLFGDGAWDNRMVLPDWRTTSPDDFLLCFESENSFSSTKSYVADDFFTMLDDGEGTSLLINDTRDVAVGRLPARTADQARILVDKIYTYTHNDYAGAWQNTICFMGDDGNKNMHMEGADEVAQIIAKQCPNIIEKKIYWDAYQRTTTSTGHAYPDVTRLIRQQMDEGALVMNYTGHGAANSFSHEYVVMRSDFERPTSLRLPFWFTASCDIVPFDGQEENIGESAMLNPKGGAIAFYGTTRTVYADYNLPMNRAFTRHLLKTDDNGRPNSIGEAVRLAKNELLKSSEKKDLTENKLHYALIGDPALRLALPTETATVEQIDGVPLTDSGNVPQVAAGKTVTVRGSIPGRSDFNGSATITVFDAEETIVCRINNTSSNDKPSKAFEYNDYTSTIFRGSGSVVNGEYLINFCVPLDNRYAENPCRIYVYAVNEDKTEMANGVADAFTIVSEQMLGDNPQGPDISCSVSNEGGQTVFHAEVYDDDGLNVSGSGIGHDMELIIDGQVNQTYNLNNVFEFDFGDYRRGQVTYTLPTITEGEHQLLFRAWDVLNHSSVVEMSFTSSFSYAPAAIATVRNASNHTPEEMFDLLGRKLSEQPQRGIIITRDDYGIVKKKMAGGQ